MWLFVNNHSCFGYIQITTLNNKNTFGAPYERSPKDVCGDASFVLNAAFALLGS